MEGVGPVGENMNQKKLMDCIYALIFNDPGNDEILCHLKQEMMSKIRMLMSLYDISECWECTDERRCMPPEECLKKLSRKFYFSQQQNC